METFKINSLEDFLDFKIENIKDNINSILGKLFIRSKDIKNRLTCSELIGYNNCLTIDGCNIVIENAKEEIKKYPYLSI